MAGEVPDIGLMRELVVFCPAWIEPSPDATLESVRKNSPLLETRAQVFQAQPVGLKDYRAETQTRNMDWQCLIRTDPRVVITTNDVCFWPLRRNHLMIDYWLRVREVVAVVSIDRFTKINMTLEAANDLRLLARNLPSLSDFKGHQEFAGAAVIELRIPKFGVVAARSAMHAWVALRTKRGLKHFKSEHAKSGQGRVYRRRGGKFHRASLPGAYPASDTGKLMAGTRSKARGLEGHLGTNVFYAKYLLGTRKMAPRKLYRDALVETFDTAGLEGAVRWRLL